MPSSSFAARVVRDQKTFLASFKVAVITASLAFALPVSIAVFPQEARFEAASLEPELHHLRLMDGSSQGEVTYLYANKGL